MLRIAMLALNLVQGICSVAAPIAAQVFGVTLPQSSIQRAHEAIQSLFEGILRLAVVDRARGYALCE
jgi:hypothetical protein